MRKIIIAICGIILTGGAMGAPEHYKVPKQIFYSPDVWKAYNNGKAYTNNLDSTLYTNLASQMSKVSTNVHGTNEDEGAIVLIMARDISNNGGEFCMTQIQAANQNGRRYTWLDYYDYPGKYKCKTLCRPGYWGTNCEKTDTPNSCDNDELSFGDYTKQMSGEWNNQITDKVKVFIYNNAEGESDTTTRHRILAVIKKMKHGVIVSPVEVIGERYQSGTGDGKFSYVKSVHSNGQEFLLCAKGYKANTGETDCEELPFCKEKAALDDLCPGYTSAQYDREQHDLKPGIDANGNACTVIRCAYDGYGFKSANDTTCVECSAQAKSGIDDSGVCHTCTKTGEYFNGSECTSQGVIQRTMQDLIYGVQHKFNCWMEMGGDAYKECVNCSEGETYNKSTKLCE